MFTFLKFFLYFSISFAILCIPMQNKILFVRLYEVIGPKSGKLVTNFGESTSKSIKQGLKISKQFFDNSKPQSIEEIKGSISSGVVQVEKKSDEVSEAITDEEEKFLKKVLKEAE